MREELRAVRARLGRSEVGRFVVVGVANTVVSYLAFRGVFALLGGRAGAPGVAQVAAYAAGIACSFTLNRAWTFRSSAARAPELARFVTSQLAMLALSTVAMELDVDLLRLPATPSWVATTGAVAVVNYLALRHWVFRARVVSAPPAS